MFLKCNNHEAHGPTDYHVYIYTVRVKKNSTKVPLTVTVLPKGTVQSTVGVPLKYRRVPPKYRSVPSLVPLKYLESTVRYL